MTLYLENGCKTWLALNFFVVVVVVPAVMISFPSLKKNTRCKGGSYWAWGTL